MARGVKRTGKHLSAEDRDDKMTQGNNSGYVRVLWPLTPARGQTDGLLVARGMYRRNIECWDSLDLNSIRRLVSQRFLRLVARGYSRRWLVSIFAYSLVNEPASAVPARMIGPPETSFNLHVQLHPCDAISQPPCYLSPSREPAFPDLRNRRNASLNISRLIVAYDL
jgi:hypothetical protein